MKLTSLLLRPRAAALALVAGLAFAALPAHALFKVVGPDGKVTYTDRPPPAVDGRATTVGRDGSAATTDASLPFALRQVMVKFPVTLYTADACEACDMGRALLTRRGIPFAERTATTPEDKEAWQKLVGGQEAPVLRVGQQVMRGFNAAQWEETLDVAGYSRQSQLPPNYKAAVAEPLVERKPVRAPVAAPEAPAAVPPPVDTRSTPGNIRF
jgi:glutaredoxin